LILAGFPVGVFLARPGFLFSSDIVNFGYLFFFSATFLPANRRTYKHGRFWIRHEVIFLPATCVAGLAFRGRSWGSGRSCPSRLLHIST
jgi:hypothetical protein